MASLTAAVSSMATSEFAIVSLELEGCICAYCASPAMSFVVIAESATLSWISYGTISQVRRCRIAGSTKGIRSTIDSVSCFRSQMRPVEMHLEMYDLKDKVIEEQL